MDFVLGLSKVRGGYNALWVIVDQLTKSGYLILVKNSMNTDWLG